MKSIKYIILAVSCLLFIVFLQFSCVKRISLMTPGDEFLYFISLMSDSKYEVLLDRIDEIDLSAIEHDEANRISYLAAMAAVEIGDYERAEGYLEYCLINYRRLEDYVVYHLSRVYYARGNFMGAIEMGERLLTEHPDSVWYQDMTLGVGDYYSGVREYEMALDIYDRFLKNNKKSENYKDVLLQKGKTLEINGNYDEAIGIYKTLWLEYPCDEVSVEAFNGLIRLKGLSGITVWELKERVDRLYDANCYSSAISAIAEIPALLGTTYDSLPVKEELEFTKARCYYRMRKYKKADEILEKLWDDPGHLSKTLLLYWRAKTYDKLDKDSLAIATYLEVFNKYPKSSLADDGLYLAARTFEEIKDYDNAIYYYEKYINTYSHSDRVKDIIWYIGWLYYLKGDYERAEEKFERMGRSYKKKKDYPQYLYWKARAMEKGGKVEDAIPIFMELWEKYPYTYYSYQAGERLEELGYELDIVPRETTFDPNFWDPNFGSYLDFTSDERITSHLDKAIDLMSMNYGEDARRELELVVERCVGDPDLLIEVARLLRYSGDYYTPVLIAHRNFDHHLDEYRPGVNDIYWQMKYPLSYRNDVERLCEEYDLEPYFVYSVIRAESLFQDKVYSWAGAIGLMQIMPATGEGIAKELGIENFEVDNLLDYRTNLRFGTYYLSGLMRKYEEEKVYALCGYNAGPGNAQKWKDNRDSDMEMDEFIENIPFSETRSYVKRILGFYSIYKNLYEGDNIIQ